MYNFVKADCRKIADWTSGFRKLYHKPDSNRRPEEFWNATMAHISSIGEAIRRNHYKELIKSAAHAFSWICSYVDFCNNTEDHPLFKFKNSLSEIVGLKFPGVCGHCKKIPCGCNPVTIDEQQDKSAKYQELLSKWQREKGKYIDYTLDMWSIDFWDIFSGQIHLQGIDSIGFHLLEEAGEEARVVRELVQFRGILDANIDGLDEQFLLNISNIPNLVNEYESAINILKKKLKVEKDKEVFQKIDLTSEDPDVMKTRLVKSKMDFVIELADTFSWYCAVLLKLHEIIKYEKLDDELSKTFHIEESLKEVYDSKSTDEPLKCYACRETECKCKFFPKRCLNEVVI